MQKNLSVNGLGSDTEGLEWEGLPVFRKLEEIRRYGRLRKTGPTIVVKDSCSGVKEAQDECKDGSQAFSQQPSSSPCGREKIPPLKILPINTNPPYQIALQGHSWNSTPSRLQRPRVRSRSSSSFSLPLKIPPPLTLDFILFFHLCVHNEASFRVLSVWHRQLLQLQMNWLKHKAVLLAAKKGDLFVTSWHWWREFFDRLQVLQHGWRTRIGTCFLKSLYLKSCQLL